MDRLERITQAIMPFVPHGTATLLATEIVNYRCHLTITKERRTKLGDYRHPHGKNGHRISVNGSLNQYAFLITFVHELSHLVCWEKHKNSVRPHGSEWKRFFQKQMEPYVTHAFFPKSVLDPLNRHMANPKSATVRDEVLMRALRKYDEQTQMVHLEDLPAGALFRLGKKEFRKGDKLRKRFRCLCLKTSRTYVISGIAEVLPVD